MRKTDHHRLIARVPLQSFVKGADIGTSSEGAIVARANSFRGVKA